MKKQLINKNILNECCIYSCHNKAKAYFSAFLLCDMHFKKVKKKERENKRNHSLVTKHWDINERSYKKNGKH